MSQSSQPPAVTQKAPLLQQAPVVPLDASGLTAAAVGLGLFATATLVCAMTYPDSNWFYVLATGAGIGLILVPFTAIHRLRRVRAQEALTRGSDEAKETHIDQMVSANTLVEE